MLVKRFTKIGLSAAVLAGLAIGATATAQQPIQIGFLWHMHQPNYYPYESIVQTDVNDAEGVPAVDVGLHDGL
ncbi:MAG: hypothetical protein AAFX05_14125, partial [Planctomycetota bacterium]